MLLWMNNRWKRRKDERDFLALMYVVAGILARIMGIKSAKLDKWIVVSKAADGLFVNYRFKFNKTMQVKDMRLLSVRITEGVDPLECDLMIRKSQKILADVLAGKGLLYFLFLHRIYDIKLPEDKKDGEYSKRQDELILSLTLFVERVLFKMKAHKTDKFPESFRTFSRLLDG